MKAELVELLKATPAELLRFSTQVKVRKGQVPLLVHPFFTQPYPEGYTGYRIPVRDGYEEDRSRFLKGCLEEESPLVIFEQKPDYHLLTGRIGEVNKPSVIYTVVTHPEDAKPLYGNPFDDPNIGWYTLGKIMQTAGVKHLSVGGQYMRLKKVESLDERGLPKLNRMYVPALKEHLEKEKLSVEDWIDYTAEGCAGAAARYLAMCGFDVAISPISSPDTLEAVHPQTTN